MRLPTLDHIDLSSIQNLLLSSSLFICQPASARYIPSNVFQHIWRDGSFQIVQSEIMPKIPDFFFSVQGWLFNAGGFITILLLTTKLLHAKRQDWTTSIQSVINIEYSLHLRTERKASKVVQVHEVAKLL